MPPHIFEGDAHGQLEGGGCWELKQMNGFTRVTYEWRVWTTQPWMNLIAPLAKPAFKWNHFKVLSEGGVDCVFGRQIADVQEGGVVGAGYQ